MKLAAIGPWMFRLMPMGLAPASAARAALHPAAGRAGAAVRALERHASLRIDRPRRCSIECLSGTLWITHDGDPRDLILEAGQRHVVDSAAPLLVHALAEARLCVGPRA